MKKLLFLLLLSVSMYGQTLQNPTFGNTTTNTLKIKTPATVTSVNFLSTNEADGSVSKIAPVNVNIPYTPTNYSAPTQTIGNHLSGIDTRLGQISSTSAGLTQRIYFTADNTVVNAVTYFASSALGKGSTATGSPPSLVLPDNTKSYFTKDVISIAQPSPTIGYAGTYSGNLTVSATPTPVATQQRFTVEVYRTDNLGVPIASGVSGAPVGDLGVTVVAVLDSGIINLVAGAITNIPITGVLTQNITINSGERLRYHVSAAKIGTGGGNVTFGVYYGSSYNSYYDIPVAITTDAVLNKSGVTGVTSTDALNLLNSKIPDNFTKVVYVNNNNPNSATIFDLNNPPTVNDNLLKNDVANLYIGLDASTWVYNGSIYVTKVVSSTTSNFYFSGGSVDAQGDKTSPIYRTGDLAVGTTVPRATMHSYATTASNRILFLAESDLTPTSGVTFRQGIGLTRSAMEGVNPGYALFGYNVNAQSSTSITSAVAASSDTGNVPLILMQGQRWIDSGGMPSSAITRPIFGISNYGTRLMTMLVDGKTGFGASSPTGKVDIVTGNATLGSLTSQANGSISFGNTTATTTVQPTITGKSNTSPGQGLRFVAASNNSTTLPVMQFDVRVNNDLDFSTLTTSAFKFTRFETTALFEILRNGNIIVPTTPTTSAGTYDFVTRNTSTGVLEKITSASVAPINSPTFTGDPKAPTPTAGDNDTSIVNSAFVMNHASSGTYTPTVTGVSNVNTIGSVLQATYQKIGNVVNVSVNVPVRATSNTTTTSFTVTLPINISSVTPGFLIGQGTSIDNGTTTITTVKTNTTSNVIVSFTSTNTSTNDMNITFMYLAN